MEEDAEPPPPTSSGLSIAREILKKAKGLKKMRTENMTSSYHPVNHILPTSNIVERLFSRAKLIKTDHRKTMTAPHLDALLFLRCNRSKWNEKTVQFCLHENDKRGVLNPAGGEGVAPSDEEAVSDPELASGEPLDDLVAQALVDWVGEEDHDGEDYGEEDDDGGDEDNDDDGDEEKNDDGEEGGN